MEKFNDRYNDGKASRYYDACKGNTEKKLKKIPKFKRLLLLLGLYIFIILAVFLIFNLKNAEAAGPAVTCSYQRVLIKDGDSLWQMASEHAYPGQNIEDYITEIRTVNKLQTDTIHAGRYLLMPVYSEIN